MTGARRYFGNARPAATTSLRYSTAGNGQRSRRSGKTGSIMLSIEPDLVLRPL